MALLVVWSHSFALHLGSEKSEWISIALGGSYDAGNLGVMAFFVISGFLITKSFDRSNSLKSYLIKRVRRIYPGYLVTTSLCAFVIAPLFGARVPSLPAALKIVGHNLLLKSDIPDAFFANPLPGPVNGSLWSIFYEFWCYLGVALLGTTLLKRPKLMISLCLLLWVCKVVQDASGWRPFLGPVSAIIGWQYIWTKMGPCFLLGMLAYSYRKPLPRSRALLAALLGSAVIACHINQHVADLILPPALAYAVLYVAFGHPLPSPPNRWDFSYGTYLYAFPIQQILQATVSLSLPLFIVTSMALSLAAGALSWFCVEQPFQQGRQLKPEPTLAW